MKRISAVSAGLLGLMTLTTPARTAHSDDGLPQLAAQFVQWSLSIPTDVNPVLDQTGEFCMVGQQGPVWFLAGTFFGGTVTRSCTVPEGTTLFFPVINGFALNTPNCGQTGDIKTVRRLKEFYYGYLAGFINQVQNLKATLNNKPITVQFAESVPFSVAYPPDGIFGPQACGANPDVPLAPGIYSPGLTDGYWVKLENLKASPKPYKLKFSAESVLPGNFQVIEDITYNLTVTPIYLK